MQTVTLIIDKRREIPVKYKKLLENEYSQVILSKNLVSAMKFIQDKEPDLIIISDSMGQDLDSYCKEIRALTYYMRPIIIATSKSAEMSDKMKVLESGADDFISEPINSKEFTARIRAHLRRELESNLDALKVLPNRNYSLRALKRAISSERSWVALLINIDNFENYREVYTKLASDKLLQTYAAIIASALSKEDYLGSINENYFLVITDEIKAEPIAKFLTFAFDTVAEKFYSVSDIDRGFIITQGDNMAEKRSEFVHTTIGAIPSSTKKYSDSQELLNDLVNIHRLAKLPTKSNYLIERTKLSAEDAVMETSYNNKILIIEEDEAMTLLLSTILNLQGYKTYTQNSYSEEDIPISQPAVIILDAGKPESKFGLELCKHIKENPEYKNSKIIITSVSHDKEEILKLGADLYLPKPYDMASLIKWVEGFMKEVNITVI